MFFTQNRVFGIKFFDQTQKHSHNSNFITHSKNHAGKYNGYDIVHCYLKIKNFST